MPHVRWRVLRGVAGAAGLIGAVVGVPIGLVALGQPLPTSVPGWHQVADSLGRPISDSTLLRVAGVACWLVWAAFVVAVVIELAGGAWEATSGRRRIPRIPGLQRVARTLVLTAALLLPQRGFAGAVTATASPLPASAPVHQRPVVHAEVEEEGTGGPEPDQRPAAPMVRRPAPARPAPSGRMRYVVQHYDSPWAIAERHLGDGTRWRELRDAEGRSLEGSSTGLRVGAARFIQPGEVLLLPVDAQVTVPGPPAPGVPPSVAPAGPATAVPAPPVTGTAPAPPAPPAPPLTTAPPPATASAPSASPAAPPAAPVAPTRQAIPGPPAGADGSANGQRPPVMLNVTTERRAAPRSPLSGTLLEAGLAGAAVLAVLRAFRRRQAQRRPPGRRIRLPGPPLAGSELAIRRAESGDRAELVGSAVAQLAQTLQKSGAAVPAVLGVLVDDDAVEVLLDRPAPAPEPWAASAEGFRWRIGSGEVEVEATITSAPLPALTSLGRAATGDADVLINLEAAGLVAVAGEPTRAAAVLHGMATHLCGASWAGAVDVLLIGMAPGLDLIDRVRTAPSLAVVRDELRGTAEVMSTTAADHGCADAFEGRVRGLAGDGWPPTVVLSVVPATSDEWAWLAGMTRPGSGVAAVVLAPDATDATAGAGPPTRWVIDAGASPMPVDPLRLAVQPAAIDGAAMADIGRLLEIAADASGATLAEPPYDQIDISVELSPTPPNVPAPSEPVDASLAQRLDRLRGVGGNGNGNHRDELPSLPDPEILVRVLGTIDLDGAAEFRRAKGRELVVYLSMHPHGVGEAELDEALWPSGEGRVVSAPTRDSTVSVARRAVGGPGRLLPAHGQGRDKRYQLGPGVQSDWARFCVLHRWGRDRSSIAALRTALETVRGRPFEGVVSGRTYGWIHTEGHGRHIEAEVGDAADLMARLALEAGDAMAARWAARRGLLADPYTERLWVRLMEAADVLGESQEIERVMDELGTVLELEGDFSGLHPNTLAAYDRLSRRHRFPAAR